jgi:hypothetical protein
MNRSLIVIVLEAILIYAILAIHGQDIGQPSCSPTLNSARK